MRIIKISSISIIIFSALFAVYINIPKSLKYEISDYIERVFAPGFDKELDELVSISKKDVVREYESLGYNLRCYDSIQKRSKISKYNDSLCWANINYIYDDIPVENIAFFFYQNRLTHIRIEYPYSSFDRLHTWLKVKNVGKKWPNFGVDKYGRKLLVWKGKGGLLVTSYTTQGQNNNLLWTANHILGKQRREKTAKSMREIFGNKNDDMKNASFDCEKAKLLVEKTICSDKRLRRLDRQLHELYTDLSKELGGNYFSILKNIQRYWLSVRNLESKNNYIAQRYNRQIARLNYFKYKLNKDEVIPEQYLLSLFKLLIDNRLPAPSSFKKINDYMFLIEITNIGRMGQGLYGVNLKSKKVKMIHGGGIPVIIHAANSSLPVNIVKSISLIRGKITESIGVIYTVEPELNFKYKSLFSIVNDGVAEGCGRAKSLGISKAEKMLGYSYRNSGSKTILIFNIEETDCSSGKISNTIKEFPVSLDIQSR